MPLMITQKTRLRKVIKEFMHTMIFVSCVYVLSVNSHWTNEKLFSTDFFAENTLAPCETLLEVITEIRRDK